MRQADLPLVVLVLAGIVGLGVVVRAAYGPPVPRSENVMTDQRDRAGDRWDFSTVLLVIVILLILFALTFELWIPHPMHHD